MHAIPPHGKPPASPRLSPAHTASPLPCPGPCRSLHHRDVAASLAYLHRFFDHTVEAGLGLGAPPTGGAGAAGQAPEEAAARERGRLQSAALSLGSMHVQFGHVGEAMQALNETVRSGAWGG